MADPFPELENEPSPPARSDGLKTLRWMLWLLVALVIGVGLVAMFAPNRATPPESESVYSAGRSL